MTDDNEPTRPPGMTDEQYESYQRLFAVIDEEVSNETRDERHELGRRLAHYPD